MTPEIYQDGHEMATKKATNRRWVVAIFLQHVKALNLVEVRRVGIEPTT